MWNVDAMEWEEWRCIHFTKCMAGNSVWKKIYVYCKCTTVSKLKEKTFSCRDRDLKQEQFVWLSLYHIVVIVINRLIIKNDKKTTFLCFKEIT